MKKIYYILFVICLELSFGFPAKSFSNEEELHFTSVSTDLSYSTFPNQQWFAINENSSYVTDDDELEFEVTNQYGDSKLIVDKHVSSEYQSIITAFNYYNSEFLLPLLIDLPPPLTF